VRSAVDCEEVFVRELLRTPLPGMSADQMLEYVRFTADELLAAVGASRVYGARNPFTFMLMQDIDGRHNFFERAGSEYPKTGAGTATGVASAIDDF
jgi:ribonucleotide reductase beta subunit family protein with ferritin-like domain